MIFRFSIIIETVLISFQAFLRRGSPQEDFHLLLFNDCPLWRAFNTPQKLIPAPHVSTTLGLPPVSKSLPQHLLQQDALPQDAPLQGTPLQGTPPHDAPLQGTPLEDTALQDTSRTAIAKKYFHDELHIKCNRQLNRLLKVAPGFVETERLNINIKHFESIWSTKFGIFETVEGETPSRLHRLLKGRQRIRQNKQLLFCADRLTLLFITHDVEERMFSIQDPLLPGQRRVTKVWEIVAEEISENISVLKRHRDNARCYLQLLLEGGPGDLLVLRPKESYL
jgi:hypothetical protein